MPAVSKDSGSGRLCCPARSRRRLTAALSPLQSSNKITVYGWSARRCQPVTSVLRGAAPTAFREGRATAALTAVPAAWGTRVCEHQWPAGCCGGMQDAAWCGRGTPRNAARGAVIGPRAIPRAAMRTASAVLFDLLAQVPTWCQCGGDCAPKSWTLQEVCGQVCAMSTKRE